jgi:hypothetical protein
MLFSPHCHFDTDSPRVDCRRIAGTAGGRSPFLLRNPLRTSKAPKPFPKGRLEDNARPIVNERGQTPADVLRERRRRRLEAAGSRSKTCRWRLSPEPKRLAKPSGVEAQRWLIGALKESSVLAGRTNPLWDGFDDSSLHNTIQLAN